MRKLIYLLVIASSLTLSSCSSMLDNLPWVYSLDIEQGNVIDQGMIDQLRPKMTKRQVLYIMGSSMLTDVFHQNRWDYLYSEQPGGKARRQKRLSLFFDGDTLIGVQGDFRPSTLAIAKESKETSLEVPKRNLEKTLWEKITGIFSDDEADTANLEPEPKTDADADETLDSELKKALDEVNGVSENEEDKNKQSESTDSTDNNSEKDSKESVTDTPAEVKEASEVTINPLEEAKSQKLEVIEDNSNLAADKLKTQKELIPSSPELIKTPAESELKKIIDDKSSEKPKASTESSIEKPEVDQSEKSKIIKDISNDSNTIPSKSDLKKTIENKPSEKLKGAAESSSQTVDVSPSGKSEANKEITRDTNASPTEQALEKTINDKVAKDVMKALKKEIPEAFKKIQ